MVNTGVADPTRRRINRRLDRQKRARRRQSEKLLNNPDDPRAVASIQEHLESIQKLKKERKGLSHLSPTGVNPSQLRILRDLDGLTYWVIENPKEIAELVDNHIRKEWESDIEDQEDHEEGIWLESLGRRVWSLMEIELNAIKLSNAVMDYVNPKTGYNFKKRLEERKRNLERDIDRFGAIIRPVVIRGEDNQLMDGYCRYHVLLNRHAKRTYAYIGSL